ncbi:MAG: DegQ family serine endoprotease [Stellaceae bacterium]
MSLLSLRLGRCAVVVLAVGLIALPAKIDPAAARPAPAGFADLAAKLLPSVVNVSTTQKVTGDQGDAGQSEHGSPDLPQFPPGSPFDQFFKHFFEHQHGGQPQAETRESMALGSGFIIDPAGYVVTNNHVIKDADEITVILHDNTNLKATVVGRDTKTDIAVLKITANEPLTAVTWGDSDAARVGDWVLAIGNPYGLGGTVTAGILSARQRDINSGPYDDFLQTDAAINRGNSGGPMFNMDGQVIGINTAIYSPSGGSIGIGFAVPSSIAREVVTELRNEPDHTVHRGWLGVRIQAVTDEIAESLGLGKPRGALVAGVTDKGPAQTAGIRPGDVILSFDNKPVDDMRHLPRLVAETPVGKTVALTLWRKHQQTVAEVKLGRLDESSQQVASAQPGTKSAEPGQTRLVKTLGLTLSGVTPELKNKFSLAGDVKGVVVVEVAKDSAAAAKGMRPGDLIMEAAQDEVKSPDQVSREIAQAKKSGRKSILLLVDRQGDLRFVALRLDQS